MAQVDGGYSLPVYRLPVIEAGPLPPLHDGWMRAALRAPLRGEPDATCSECAMVVPEGERCDQGAQGFDPRAKCCTHTPFLPNFLVGGILRDGASDSLASRGAESTRARIRERIAVSPLGLFAPEPRRLLERLAGDHGDFGRVRALVCPHYVDEDGGLCGIWRHRNAVCSTFFCKHTRGAHAHRAWRGVEGLLRRVEDALARHCLLVLEVSPEVLARAVGASERGPEGGHGPQLAPDPAIHRGLWGPWAGREEELYLACAEIVAPLTWDDVSRIGGAEIELRARVARHLTTDVVARRPPPVLVVGTFAGVQMGSEHTRVATYSKTDPIALPNPLLVALARFDGRATDRVVAEIAAEDGLALDDELLGSLVDFEILVTPDGA